MYCDSKYQKQFLVLISADQFCNGMFTAMFASKPILTIIHIQYIFIPFQYINLHLPIFPEVKKDEEQNTNKMVNFTQCFTRKLVTMS